MNDLINVLRSNRKLIRVELESKNANASEFWKSLTEDIFARIPVDDDRFDIKVKNTMLQFQEGDTLEIVNKQGKLLKRFAKFFKEQNGFKLDDKIAGLIGDKLQYYLSKEAKVYYIDFTDDIDWRDGQFGKSGSCWWGQYKDSQEAFISNGGWGIRFYRDENQDDNNGIGRTWIYPKDGMLMCFNSYGVERPNVSKVVKQVFKQAGIALHYKAVELSNSGNSEIPYINSGTGFVLFPEGIDPDSLDDSYDLEIEWESESRYSCCACGDGIDEDNTYSAEDDIYCEDCYNERFSMCEKCNDTFRHEDLHTVNGYRRYETQLCEYCIEEVGASMCYHCDEYHVSGIITEDTGDFYCEDCKDDHCTYCETCEEWNADDCTNHEDEPEDDTDSTDEPIEKDFITYELETISYQFGIYSESKLVTSTEMVYRHEQVKGLFVRQVENTYNITHEVSGLSVWGNINLNQALEFLNRVIDINWLQSADEISRNSELCQKVLAIRGQLS